MIGIIILLVLLALVSPDFSAKTLYVRRVASLRFHPYSGTPSNEVPPHIMAAIDAAINNALLAQVGRHDHALRLDCGRIAPEFTTPSIHGTIKDN